MKRLGRALKWLARVIGLAAAGAATAVILAVAALALFLTLVEHGWIGGSQPPHSKASPPRLDAEAFERCRAAGRFDVYLENPQFQTPTLHLRIPFELAVGDGWEAARTSWCIKRFNGERISVRELYYVGLWEQFFPPLARKGPALFSLWASSGAKDEFERMRESQTRRPDLLQPSGSRHGYESFGGYMIVLPIERARTPAGDPVVLNCFDHRDRSGATHRLSECSTNVAVGAGAGIDYSFRLVDLPPELWPDAHNAVMAFLRMVVADPAVGATLNSP